MYHAIVPTKLHHQADKLIEQLTQLSQEVTICPFCGSDHLYLTNTDRQYYYCRDCSKGFNAAINTPFLRLIPFTWLPIIASRRLTGARYSTIAAELDWISSDKVRNRERAIMQLMQQDYPELYSWYVDFKQSPHTNIPAQVLAEQQAFKDWITEQLNQTKMTCYHCGSEKTQKISQRANFRCQSCWRSISGLKSSGLYRLRHQENWLSMIDMLVAGGSNLAMQKEFGISANTAKAVREKFLRVIRIQKLNVLKDWIVNGKNR